MHQSHEKQPARNRDRYGDWEVSDRREMKRPNRGGQPSARNPAQREDARQDKRHESGRAF